MSNLRSLFLKELRVNGATPQCDAAVEIGPNDSLATKISEVARIAYKLSDLHILCHGFPDGLQLGSRFVTQNDALEFLPLRSRVRIVYIHGCSAARNYVGNGGTYNGQQFCSNLAREVRAGVVASDATQFYLPSSSFYNSSSRNQLLRWQGNVGAWNVHGVYFAMSSQDQRDTGIYRIPGVQ